jgi:hypothetical protein
VWEVDRLIEGLFESQDGDRLTDPARNDERCYYTHDRHYAEATNSQYRHEHLG